MDHSQNFVTEEEIDESGILELRLSEIKELLDEYVYFKGLIETDDKQPRFVDGYFILEETASYPYQFTHEEYEQDLHLVEADWPDTVTIKAVTGTKFSNNDALVSKTFNLQKERELEDILYSYQQLVEVAAKVGLPKPKPLEHHLRKKFNYDVDLVNKKSLFSVYEASYIAANKEFPLFNQYGSYVSAEYQAIITALSDCIKDQHETGFHLITRELWVKGRDEFGEEYSKWYENGTRLKARVELDLEATLISKSELIRWCEFMGIETGLKVNSKEPPVSVEALEAKIANLTAELADVKSKHYREKEKLEDTITSLEELLKNRDVEAQQNDAQAGSLSFPIPTKKLKVALDAQKKFWLDFDESQLPLQKNIQSFIAEQLDKNPQQTNMDARELAKAIQPDYIKRKN